MFHSSGRCRRGSQLPKSSRKEKIRSLARARSSSRRAPPNAASKPCSSIASSNVVVCSRLREARGPVSSTTRPRSIDSWTEATTSCSPSSATRRSRKAITSGKLCPVSTCMSGKGNRPGRNAFSARRSRPLDSFPPLKSRTGFSSSAATSRMTWIASASSACRWERAGTFTRSARRPAAGGGHVQAALELVRAGPPPLAAAARVRAGRAADGGVARVVQRVVGEVALVDRAPDVALRPVDEGVELPDPAALVELDALRAGTRGRLLAPKARDPAGRAVERPLQGRDLGGAAAVLGAGPVAGGLLDLDLHAEALLEGAPRRQRLGEEHAGVDRDDARCVGHLQERVDQHRLLLLEGAEQDQAVPVLRDGVLENL